jgi:predicted O-methyltransferase YrrM
MRPHTYFLIQLVKSLNVSSYLELGVQKGDTFFEIKKVVKNCVGVDIKPRIDGILNMPTDNFFKINKSTFDFIFIDADHTYEQVLKDFINSMQILNTDGVCALHDTYPIDKSMMDKTLCGTACQIENDLKNFKKFEYISLPIGTEGLTLVRKKYRRFDDTDK